MVAPFLVIPWPVGQDGLPAPVARQVSLRQRRRRIQGFLRWEMGFPLAGSGQALGLPPGNDGL